MNQDWGIMEDGVVTMTFSDKETAVRLAAKPGRTLVRWAFGWQPVD